MYLGMQSKNALEFKILSLLQFRLIYLLIAR